MSHSIQLLTSTHDCSNFSCGNEWLDRYIRKNALRNQQNGYGRSYLLIRDESQQIDGYYTISMSSVRFENLPPDMLYNQMPKYPMPSAHLGCLAVASELQGKGLGPLMLMDALRRMVAASAVLAARTIDVKAIDEKARDWYAKYGFLPFLDLGEDKGLAPFHMYLPMETAKQIVAKIDGQL